MTDKTKTETKTDDFDDEKTLVRRQPPTVAEYELMLDDLTERDELVQALVVPEEIDTVAHAKTLAGLYALVLKRAGLDKADPHAVALVATPESLLALLDGKLEPTNPLAALAKPDDA
jgi:hypothetical protein